MASRHHPHHSKTFQEEIPPTPKIGKVQKIQDEEKKSNLLLMGKFWETPVPHPYLGGPLFPKKNVINFAFLHKEHFWSVALGCVKKN